MNDLFDAATLNGLIDRIEHLTPETQRQWGTMTVDQMLKHVQGPLDQATGAIELKIPFLLRLFGPGIKRKLLEGKYGKGGRTAAAYKVSTGMDFDREKAMAIRKLRELAARGPDFFEGRKHPLFGRMSAHEWSTLQIGHLDHHLRQFGV